MRTLVTTLIPILALACAGEAGRTPPPSTAEGSTTATAAEASASSKPPSTEATGRPAIELPVLGTSVAEDWQPSVSAPVAPPSATCRGRLDVESVRSCPAALAPALRDALRRAPPVQRDRALAELQGCFADERGALVNLRAALQSFSVADMACAARALRGPQRAELEGRIWAAHLTSLDWDTRPWPRDVSSEAAFEQLERERLPEFVRRVELLRRLGGDVGQLPEGPGRRHALVALFRSYERLSRWHEAPAKVLRSERFRADWLGRWKTARSADGVQFDDALGTALVSALQSLAAGGTLAPTLMPGSYVAAAPLHGVLRGLEQPSDVGSPPSFPEPHFQDRWPEVDDAWLHRRSLGLSVLGLRRAYEQAERGTPAERAALYRELGLHHLTLALLHFSPPDARRAAQLLASGDSAPPLDRALAETLASTGQDCADWLGDWREFDVAALDRLAGRATDESAARARIDAFLLGRKARTGATLMGLDVSRLRPEESACFDERLIFLADRPRCVEYSWRPRLDANSR